MADPYVPCDPSYDAWEADIDPFVAFPDDPAYCALPQASLPIPWALHRALNPINPRVLIFFVQARPRPSLVILAGLHFSVVRVPWRHLEEYPPYHRFLSLYCYDLATN